MLDLQIKYFKNRHNSVKNILYFRLKFKIKTLTSTIAYVYHRKIKTSKNKIDEVFTQVKVSMKLLFKTKKVQMVRNNINFIEFRIHCKHYKTSRQNYETSRQK